MGQIKYRAWDDENSTMITPETWHSNVPLMNWFGNVYENGKLLNYKMLLSYSFLDEEGNYIYEGDILQREDSKDYFPVVVCFGKYKKKVYGTTLEEFGFYLTVNGNDDEIISDGFQEYIDMSGIKVIGNIYQHPELLEQSQ